MIFNLEKEKRVPAPARTALTNATKDVIIDRFSKHLGLQSYPFKILLICAFQDKSFNLDFIPEVAKQIAPTSHTFIEIGFGIYSLLHTRNVKNKLTKMADKYGVDPHSANSFLHISSKLELSSKGWKNFMTSDLMEVITKGFRVSKNEVVGLIQMLMGDFKSKNVDLIL